MADTKEQNVEAAKVVGRNGILVAVSALIAGIANWLISLILTIPVPLDITTAFAGVVYAVLLFVDKKIHENKTKLTGLVPF